LFPTFNVFSTPNEAQHFRKKLRQLVCGSGILDSGLPILVGVVCFGGFKSEGGSGGIGNVPLLRCNRDCPGETRSQCFLSSRFNQFPPKCGKSVFRDSCAVSFGGCGIRELRSYVVIRLVAPRMSCNPMIRNAINVYYALAILDPSHRVDRLREELGRSCPSRKPL